MKKINEELEWAIGIMENADINYAINTDLDDMWTMFIRACSDEEDIEDFEQRLGHIIGLLEAFNILKPYIHID